MPAVEAVARHQYAVLWARTGYDDYGQHSVISPIEIRVRWQFGKSGFKDPNRNNIDYDATAVVDKSIAVGSLMFLGRLITYTNASTKYQVVDYKETPDLKGRQIHRLVLLKRLNDATV